MAMVVAVSRSAKHGFSKQVQPSIRLNAGEGVEGDAHSGRTVQHLYHLRKDPTRPNLSQVHLFAAEMLDELAGKGFRVDPGAIGENVLTEGVALLGLPLGTVLRLGTEAVVEITGLRTPCSKIDRLLPGLQEQLWGERDPSGKRARRAGVMSVVRAGGVVAPGAQIQVVMPPEPYQALPPL